MSDDTSKQDHHNAVEALVAIIGELNLGDGTHTNADILAGVQALRAERDQWKKWANRAAGQRNDLWLTVRALQHARHAPTDEYDAALAEVLRVQVDDLAVIDLTEAAEARLIERDGIVRGLRKDLERLQAFIEALPEQVKAKSFTSKNMFGFTVVRVDEVVELLRADRGTAPT